MSVMLFFPFMKPIVVDLFKNILKEPPMAVIVVVCIHEFMW